MSRHSAPSSLMPNPLLQKSPGPSEPNVFNLKKDLVYILLKIQFCSQVSVHIILQLHLSDLIQEEEN